MPVDGLHADLPLLAGMGPGKVHMNYCTLGFALLAAALLQAGCARQPAAPAPDSPDTSAEAQPAENGAPLSAVKATGEETVAEAMDLMERIDNDLHDEGFDADDARRFRARFRGRLAAAGVDVDTVNAWVSGN
jgi:hypothetical protein